MNDPRPVEQMTRKEFWALTERQWSDDVGAFDSLVILPTRRKHDSGYRCMDFVAVRGHAALCRLSGCSDVVHIDGIGGYGQWRGVGDLPRLIPPKGWSIDCLATSGLLRLFADCELTCGPALSSFEIYCRKEAT